MVPIRLSEEEYETLKQKADACGTTIPAFIRSLALNARAPLVSKKLWTKISDRLKEAEEEFYSLERALLWEDVKVVDLSKTGKALSNISRRLSELERNSRGMH
ncbi:hypothetical protein AM598_11725 [Paenibacillus polymyxa]|nr:hypothetical protein AM598_11725 [Paenibacillus polymyxa]